MILKKEIIKKVLEIRGIINNDALNDNSKIEKIDYVVNRILLRSIKDPHD